MSSMLKIVSIISFFTVTASAAVVRSLSPTRRAIREERLAQYMGNVARFMDVAADSDGFDLRNQGKIAIAESETLPNGWTVWASCGSLRKLWLSGNRMRGHVNVFKYLTPAHLPEDAAIEFPELIDEACRVHARTAKGFQEAGVFTQGGTYCYAFVHGYITRAIRGIRADRNIARFFAGGESVESQLAAVLAHFGIDALNRSFMQHYYPLMLAVMVQQLFEAGQGDAVVRLLGRLPARTSDFSRLVTTDSWMSCSLKGGEKAFREFSGGSGPVPGMRVYDIVLTQGDGVARHALFAAAARAGCESVVESMLHTDTVFPERLAPDTARGEKTVLHTLCGGALSDACITRCLRHCDKVLEISFGQRDSERQSALHYLQAAHPHSARLHQSCSATAACQALSEAPVAVASDPSRGERLDLVRALCADHATVALTDVHIAAIARATVGWSEAQLTALMTAAKAAAGADPLELRHVISVFVAHKAALMAELESEGLSVVLPDIQIRTPFDALPGLSKEAYRKAQFIAEELIGSYKNRDRRHGGLHEVRGYTLVGPYGTGKTTLAKVIADLAGAVLYVPTTPAAGERAVARAATHHSPVIIFFDELERFAPRLGTAAASAAGAGSAASFKAMLESPRHDLRNAVVLGATNHPTHIDAGVIASRMMPVHMTFLERKQRELVVLRYLREHEGRFAEGVDLDVLAERLAANSEALTGRDIATALVADLRTRVRDVPITAEVCAACLDGRYEELLAGAGDAEDRKNVERKEFQAAAHQRALFAARAPRAGAYDHLPAVTAVCAEMIAYTREKCARTFALWERTARGCFEAACAGEWYESDDEGLEGDGEPVGGAAAAAAAGGVRRFRTRGVAFGHVRRVIDEQCLRARALVISPSKNALDDAVEQFVADHRDDVLYAVVDCREALSAKELKELWQLADIRGFSEGRPCLLHFKYAEALFTNKMPIGMDSVCNEIFLGERVTSVACIATVSDSDALNPMMLGRGRGARRGWFPRVIRVAAAAGEEEEDCDDEVGGVVQCSVM